MKFLFIVQGEGRGHLTQSIALKEILTRNGHEVVAVLVGKSNRRELPCFFSQIIQSPVLSFNSPNFLPAAKNKKNNIWTSVAYNLFKAGTYIRSLFFIRNQIQNSGADVVINFYDLLTGLTYGLLRPSTPCICIAHQYIFLHPDFQFPPENKTELMLLKFFTRITCANASKILALSIRKMEGFTQKKITVVPPLLRKDVLRIPCRTGNYLHGYLLNDGFADEIIRLQQQFPDEEMHFFWDRKGAEETTVINKHLSFHRLNDRLFLEYMSGCKAFATTAGFESVCEAMYWGKPVLMVPTHIEQACNAHEACLAGAGIVSDRFDLTTLLSFIPGYKKNEDFRCWVQQSESYMIKELFEPGLFPVENLRFAF